MKELNKFNDIAFVGTYECNTNCEYCFSGKYIKPYKGVSLSFVDYKNIFDKIVSNGVNSISFIGGEPALWTNISDAIKYARENNVKTTVFTNGILQIKESPDNFFIHLNVLFLTKYKSILENLYYYSKKSKILFIYNVYKPNKYSLKLLLKILESFKFDYAISFNIVFDKNIDKSYGDFIYEAYNYISLNLKKDVISSGPLPNCIFRDEYLEFLQNNFIVDKTYGEPGFNNTDVFFTVVNPDGKTVLSCAPINIKLGIKYLLNGDYNSYKNNFTNTFAEIINTGNDFCNGCPKFNKECQYGGILNLYNSKEILI